MPDHQRRLLDEFKKLLQLGPDLDTAVVATVRQLRDAGVTWQTIGQANYMTRQAAIQRWGRKVRAAQPLTRPSPSTAEAFRGLIAPFNSSVIRPSEPPTNGDRC